VLDKELRASTVVAILHGLPLYTLAIDANDVGGLRRSLARAQRSAGLRLRGPRPRSQAWSMSSPGWTGSDQQVPPSHPNAPSIRIA